MSKQAMICTDCLGAEASQLSAEMDSVQWQLNALYPYFDKKGHRKALKIQKRLRRTKETLDWMAETLERGGRH